MLNIESANINNKRIYSVKSKDELLRHIENKYAILISMNAEAIMNNDKAFEDIINNNIAFPDGVGAVMALKNKGFDAVKIPGIELWLEIIKHNPDKKIYLIGSTREVIQKTKQQLNLEFKGIHIVGCHDGYFDEAGYLKIEKDVLDKKPDIVFIAMGQPKQEFMAKRLFEKHKALYMGVGGSFDIYSGVKKRAKQIFLNLNLEWLYRLLQEPARFGRQLNLIKFIFYLKSGRL